MTYTLVLDKLMLMGTTRTEVRVISERAQEIREAILAEMDRGVTMLSGETGYLKTGDPDDLQCNLQQGGSKDRKADPHH